MRPPSICCAIFCGMRRRAAHPICTSSRLSNSGESGCGSMAYCTKSCARPRICVLARLDIAERRVPQDGRLRIPVENGKTEEYRVNTLPTLFGEKLVLRRLDTLPPGLALNALGFDAAQRDTLEAAIRAPHGMVLVTGPTGSGKTVT